MEIKCLLYFLICCNFNWQIIAKILSNKYIYSLYVHFVPHTSYFDCLMSGGTLLKYAPKYYRNIITFGHYCTFYTTRNIQIFSCLGLFQCLFYK